VCCLVVEETQVLKQKQKLVLLFMGKTEILNLVLKSIVSKLEPWKKLVLE